MRKSMFARTANPAEIQHLLCPEITFFQPNKNVKSSSSVRLNQPILNSGLGEQRLGINDAVSSTTQAAANLLGIPCGPTPLSLLFFSREREGNATHLYF